MKLAKEVYITGYKRTAIGSFMGSLSSIKAVDLGGKALRGAVNESRIKPDQVEDVYMSIVMTNGVGQNPVKQSCIIAGIP